MYFLRSGNLIDNRYYDMSEIFQCQVCINSDKFSTIPFH